MTDSYKTSVDAALQPTDVDVLLGKAPNHPGNVFLKELVLRRYEEYEAAPLRNEVTVDGTEPTTKSKEEITTEILKTITSTRGGRFLKKDGGRWVVATDKTRIRRKITDSFKKHRKNRKGQDNPPASSNNDPFPRPEDHNVSDENGDDDSQGSVDAVIVKIEERLQLEGYGDEEEEEGAIIHQPSLQDVMPGRGSVVHNHPGNRRYRLLAQSFVAEFHAPNRTTEEKREIAKKIYQSVTSNGGHFLAPVNGEPRMAWKIKSEADALKKIKQALRDMKSPTTTEPASPRATMNETKTEWESSGQLSHPSVLVSIEETMSVVSEEIEKLSVHNSKGKSDMASEVARGDPMATADVPVGSRTAMLSNEIGISKRTLGSFETPSEVLSTGSFQPTPKMFDSNRVLSKASRTSTESPHYGLDTSNRSLGSFKTPLPPSSFQPTPNIFGNNDRTLSKASTMTTTSGGDVSMNSGGASNAMDQDDMTTMSVDGNSLSVNSSDNTGANKNAASSSSNQQSTTQEEVGSSRTPSRSLGGFLTSAPAKSQGSNASSSNQRGSHTLRSLEEFMSQSANQSTGNLSRASMSTSTTSH